MKGEIDDLNRQNRALSRDITDLKHKLTVQQTLRKEFKDFVRKNMTVFDIKEQAMDALSQIEKQHLTSLDETGGFTDTALSPFDLKSKLTNTDLTLDNEINQRFSATMMANGGMIMPNILATQKIGENNEQTTFIDGSFSNNLGQSFLGGSNFNYEMMLP